MPTYTDTNGVVYTYTVPALGTTTAAASITGYTGSETIATPLASFVEGEVTYSVTTISSNAFFNNTAITSVTIPISVTSLGASSFQGCSGLTSITIPSSVTSIGAFAFRYCTGLTSLTMNSFVSNLSGALSNMNSTNLSVIFNYSGAIPDSSFFGMTYVKNVTINSNIISIGAASFQGCTGLTSITIPSSVTSIGASALRSCTGLTSLTIPSSVTSVGVDVCRNNTGLISIIINSSAVGTTSFIGCTKVTSITLGTFLSGIQGIATSVNNIGLSITFDYDGQIQNSACQNVTNLANITLGSNIRSIGNNAFLNCSKITSLTLPSSLTSIGDSAFRNCSVITGSLTLPSSVTSIGISAFDGCAGITGSITIPNLIANIATRAFAGCSGITGSITIPSSLTSIGNNVFNGCIGITSIIINSIAGAAGALGGVGSITSGLAVTFDFVGAIPNGACNGVTSLTSVTFGSNITNLGDNAFAGCSRLTSVIIPTLATSIGSSTFQGTGLTSITIPNTIAIIGNFSFSGCTGLTSFTIPSSVTSMGRESLTGCTGITNLVLNSSYAGIDILTVNNPGLSVTFDYAGDGYVYGAPDCNNLVNVTFGPNIKYITSEAFRGTSLTSVTLPASITYIEQGAFIGCRTISNIIVQGYIPGGEIDKLVGMVLYINQAITDAKNNGTNTNPGISITFDYAGPVPASVCRLRENVINVKLGPNITSIEEYAFDGCIGLTDFIIPNSVTSINNNAFLNCSGLSSISMSNSVINIDDSAFSGCTGLLSFSMPDTIINIGAEAFYGCTGLTGITIPWLVTSIGARAFYGCTGITGNITIPSSVTSFGTSYYNELQIDIFSGCTGITSMIINSSSASSAIKGLTNNPDIVVTFDFVGAINDSACRDFTNLSNITIGSNITSIGSYAFSGCSRITKLTIPSSVTSIGYGCLFGCSGLTSLTVKSYLTTLRNALQVIHYENFGTVGSSNFSITFDYNGAIPDGVCVSIPNLTGITFGPNITSIGDDAFDNCTGLTSVSIPSSVTSISSYAFNRCSSLTSVYFLGTAIPTILTGNFTITGDTAYYNSTTFIYSRLASFTTKVPVVLPSPPTNLTTSVSGKTATINFTPGSSNNANYPITSYKYAYSTTTSTGTYTSFTSDNLSWTTGSSSISVSNLPTGSYHFKLKAINGMESNESTASDVVTVANYAPNPPTITAANVSERTVTLNFNVGLSNGSNTVTGYKYAYSTTTSTGTYTSFTSNNLSWTNGSTSLKISELALGNRYYFKLKSNNSIDSSESNSSYQVTLASNSPNSPTNIIASISGRTATITFTVGEPNGSAVVTSYKYASSSDGITYNDYIPSNWTSGTSFTISNLSSGSYYFKLQADNGTTSSDASDASNQVTVLNFAPATPTNVTASASSGVVTINFTAGDPNGSLNVTSYKYAVSTNGGAYGSPIISNWTSGSSFTISGLTIGNNYNFKLTANNGIDSVASNASDQVTVSNFAPNKPTITSVNVSGRTATINFTQDSNGSLAVTSYKYAYSTTVDGSYSFTTSNWTSGTSFTVSNLNTGSYYFKLQATNGIDSDASDASNQVTVLNFAPATPTNVTASASNGVVTINFTAGDPNGSLNVTSYKYAVSTNGGAYGSPIISNWTSGTSFIISGLTIGNNYNFKLTANNGIDSVASNASDQVTVSNFAPNKPTITSVNVSGRTATINFTQDSNGSLAVSSYKYAYSTTTSSGTYTSFTSNNLSLINGTSLEVSNLSTGIYYFKLQGNNGLDSDVSFASSRVDIVPDAPEITNISLSGLTSVIIRFTQIALSAIDITNYQYAFKTSVNGTYSSYSITNLSWSPGSYSLTISDLTPGQLYYFKIKGYKNSVFSNESNESTGIFINFAPATPQISSIDAFNGSASVNFTVSNNGSAEITKYMYSTDSPVTSNSVFNDFPLINGLYQTISPLLINRLNNGTTYSFTITGFNGINSQASNTINNIVMSASQPAPRITGGQLKDGIATLYIEARTFTNLANISNYAYSTNGINYTTFSPVQNTIPLSISGLSESSPVSLTVKSINGPNIFSNPSNQIILIPTIRQPAPTMTTSSVTAKDNIARIPFSQTLVSSRGDDAIVKYLYCTDTNITASSVFIDVPLNNGFVQTTSPFVIPFTISNPENTPSLSFTFKSYTNSGIYSLASTAITVFVLNPQPPPTILSVEGDGNGTATITITQDSIYSYAPSITNYEFSTDGTNYKYFDPPQTTGLFKIYGLVNSLRYNFTFKTFNGSRSEASNTVTNVLINYSPPPPPVITSAGGASGVAYIYFTQDKTGLTKNITDYAYRLNNRGPFINLNMDPSETSFMISGLSNGKNIIVMKSTNGAFSIESNIETFYMYSLDSSTYIDPEYIV